MTLAIETASINSTYDGQKQNFTVTLTTTGADELIVLLIGTEVPLSTTPVTITGVSGGSGLTWKRRSTFAFDITAGAHTGHALQEIWWAWASSPMSAQTITIATNSVNTDNMAATIFGVTGLPPAASIAPWDASGSLPATNGQAINVDIPVQVTGVSTVDPAPLVIATLFNINVSNPLSNAAGSGHTLLSFNAFGHNNNVSAENEYFLPGSALSNATVALNSGTHRNWVAMVDAIVSKPPPVPFQRRVGAVIT